MTLVPTLPCKCRYLQLSSINLSHMYWVCMEQARGYITVQFSLFLHPDQAQNTSSGIQGQEVMAVAVI